MLLRLAAAGVIGGIASATSLKTTSLRRRWHVAMMALAAGVLRCGNEHPPTRPP